MLSNTFYFYFVWGQPSKIIVSEQLNLWCKRYKVYFYLCIGHFYTVVVCKTWNKTKNFLQMTFIQVFYKHKHSKWMFLPSISTKPDPNTISKYDQFTHPNNPPFPKQFLPKLFFLFRYSETDMFLHEMWDWIVGDKYWNRLMLTKMIQCIKKYQLNLFGYGV